MKKRVSDESIILLKNNLKSLERVEAYLRSHDWKVEIFIDVRTLVESLMAAEEVPKYILIGLEHPQKQVQHLPALISKHFGATLIAYFEKDSLNLLARAEKLGISYCVPPPISGPAVERILSKVRIDEERYAEYREKQERARRARLGDDPGKSPDKPGWGAPAVVTPAAAAEKGRTDLIFTDRNIGKAFSEVQKGAPSLAERELKAALDAFFSTFDELPEPPRKMDAESQGGIASDRKRSPTSGPDRITPGDPLDVFDPHWRKPLAKEAIAPKARRESARLARVGEFAPMAPDSLASFKELLNEAMRAIVDELVDPDDGLSLVTEVASMELVIRGQTTSLVGCAGKHSVRFLESLKKSMKRLAANSFLELKLSEPKSYKTPPFDFRRWAEEKCLTITVGVQERAAVGVATFNPGWIPQDILVQSSEEGLWRFSLEDLWVDVELDFEVHLHLPANKKFLRYLKKGGRLTASRKSRLKERGISEIHIRFLGVQDFDEFIKQYQFMKSVAGYCAEA